MDPGAKRKKKVAPVDEQLSRTGQEHLFLIFIFLVLLDEGLTHLSLSFPPVFIISCIMNSLHSLLVLVSGSPFPIPLSTLLEIQQETRD